MRTTFMHTLNSRVLPLGLVLGLAVTACLMPGCRAARIAAARKALQQESGQPSGIAEVTQLEYESPDAALAALTHTLRLAPDAPFVVFAAGRIVGWLAHAMEQGRSGQLIRPRAQYVGP